ncbi:hypothetical protein BH20BAC1_BH20BAC1_12970 [soil metagenome]
MKQIKKHNIIRELVKYTLASGRCAAKSKVPHVFLKDIGYFRQWWKFRKSAAGTLTHKVPWLVFGAIDFLDGFLNRGMKIFEYGSGGSTIFYANRVAEVISIEHDPVWYSRTKQVLEELSVNNVDYRQIEPVPEMDFHKKSISSPADHISARKEYRDMNIQRYVTSINEYPDNSFDLVSIDGRARQSCIAYALPMIKPGGALLIDNANRKHYLKANLALGDNSKWKLISFAGHFPFASAWVLNQTNIYIRI